ncbi:unnamed protein product [Calypogeia fissa]
MGGRSSDDDDDEQVPREREAAPGAPKGCEAQCWGCALWLVLPGYVPIFKCGWCGALTINKPKAQRSKWKRRLWTFRDRLFVLGVILIIISMICGGVWAAFPVLFPSISFGLLFHTTITFLLSFNTLFNFAVASFIAPGPTRRVSWGNVGAAKRSSLEGYTFCDYCKWPKPRRAHHCRTCDTCVLDMDHHCPFIGNCVGANNHRHFILFLLYTVLSSVYVFGMALYTGLRIWPSVITSNRMDNFGNSLSFSMGAGALAVVANAILISGRAVALLYLLVASVAIVTGVGILLQQQLSFLYSGSTFIDSIQAASKSRGQEGWDNLRQVFGNGHPIFWALPILPEATPRKIHVR